MSKPLFHILRGGNPCEFSTTPRKSKAKEIPLYYTKFPPRRIIYETKCPTTKSRKRNKVSIRQVLLMQLPKRGTLLQRYRPRGSKQKLPKPPLRDTKYATKLSFFGNGKGPQLRQNQKCPRDLSTQQLFRLRGQKTKAKRHISAKVSTLLRSGT